MDKQGVVARISFEMMGSPKDFLESTLHKIIEDIKQYQGPKVLSCEEFPAEPHEQMFSAFAELEMQFASSQMLTQFCYRYTPTRIELISPKEFLFSMKEYEDFMNDFLMAMHDNFMVTKQMQADNELLNSNVINLLKNIIKLTLFNGDKTLHGIATSIGVQAEMAKPFVEALVKEGLVTAQGDLYVLNKQAHFKQLDAQNKQAALLEEQYRKAHETPGPQDPGAHQAPAAQPHETLEGTHAKGRQKKSKK